MGIIKELIQPYSPEHFDYFLGWFYHADVEFKTKIWNIILSGREKIEFNEFYFIIDIEHQQISVYSIYDSGTHNPFFTRQEWCLNLSFDKFKVITGIQEIDYTHYYETKDDCELALMLLTEHSTDFVLSKDIFLDIHHQIELMYHCMDLNDFIPDYHIKNNLNNHHTDFMQFLYQLALSYIQYAKPVDIIAQSKLSK